MLQKKYTAIGWLLLLVLFISSCTSSTTPKQTKYIPKDASIVFSINPKKLQDKLADSKVSIDSILRSAFSGDSSMMITSGDMANSGIDLTKDIFLFVNQAGSMMSGSSVTIGAVAVMDKTSAFEDFLKKKMPSAQIKKEKEYSYALLKDNSIVGWNDDIVLVENVTSGGSMQSGEQTAMPDAAHQQLNTLFTQKEDASLASLKEFKDANDGKADMFFWSNSNGSLSSIPMIGMSKASDLLKDTYSSGAINFEDGKVEMDMKTFPNAALKDTLKKYAGPKVDMDLLNKYPGAVNGYALFSFDPKVIIAILNFIGVTQTANQFLQSQGYSLDDVTKAFKGDFAIMFSNVGATPANPQNGMTNSNLTARLVIDAAIGDKTSYDKIMSQLAKQGMLVMKNGQYQPAMMDEASLSYRMYADTKNLVFASDSVLLKQYVGGSGKVTLPSDVSSKTKGSAVAFYVDIASILNAIPSDSSSMEINNAAKQTFKDVIATSDNYGDGVVKGHAELHTMNEKENSLATLTRYFGSMAETMKKMKDAGGMGDVEMPSDSTVVAPPQTDSAGQ